MSISVLTIDDDEAIRDMVEMVLVRAGFEVFGAATPAEALYELKARRIDLVLLDLHLEKESGLDLLRVIRKLPGAKGIPVIIFSGAHDEEAWQEGRSLGAHSCLVKANFSLNEFLVRVRLALVESVPVSGVVPVLA